MNFVHLVACESLNLKKLEQEWACWKCKEESINNENANNWKHKGFVGPESFAERVRYIKSTAGEQILKVCQDK